MLFPSKNAFHQKTESALHVRATSEPSTDTWFKWQKYALIQIFVFIFLCKKNKSCNNGGKGNTQAILKNGSMKWLNVGTQMILYWRRGGGEGFKKKKKKKEEAEDAFSMLGSMIAWWVKKGLENDKNSN